MSSTNKNKANNRKVRMLEIDINLLKDLEGRGIVTRASVERAIIINDYLSLKHRYRRIEMLYFKLSEIHNKSYYTIRNIILKYDKVPL